MHIDPFVSIIAPCYNGENYISRFLDSILAQDYDNIELIVINDGSTDNTLEILESYRSKFEKRNYKYIILEQENSGQSEAINKGLKVFSGVYMTWIDSDDALTSNAISKKVEFMESHPKIGLSICKIKVVEFGTFKEIGEQKRIPPSGNDNLFFDLIAGNNVFYTPGGYMVRASMFRDAMPLPLKIQSPREIGQNFQLLLPISFKYPIGYIDEYLFYYSIRRGSHSRVKHTFEEKNRIIDISDDVLKNIARNINADSKTMDRVFSAINARIIRSRMKILLEFRRQDNINSYEYLLKKTGAYHLNDTLIVLKIKYPVLRCILSMCGKIKRFLESIVHTP